MDESVLARATRSATTGRLFAGLVIAVCIILFILRYWIGDFKLSAVTASIVEALMGTFVAALGIAAFAKYFLPKDTSDEVVIVEPRSLGSEFSKMLGSTDSWKYKGNFGRYFRTVVLPRLSERASSEHKSIPISCVIIDPTNDNLCKLHAHARNSVRAADGKRDWSPDDVKREVFATIVCCFCYRSSVKIYLGLIQYFEPQRFDIASTAAIITREDRLAPAVMLKPPGYLFSAASRDYQNAYDQCREIEVGQNNLRIDLLEPDAVIEVLKCAGLGGDFLVDNIQDIISRAKSKANPYA